MSGEIDSPEVLFVFRECYFNGRGERERQGGDVMRDAVMTKFLVKVFANTETI